MKWSFHVAHFSLMMSPGSSMNACRRFWADDGQTGTNPKVRVADNTLKDMSGSQEFPIISWLFQVFQEPNEDPDSRKRGPCVVTRAAYWLRLSSLSGLQ